MNAYQFEPPPLVLTDGGAPQLINLTNVEPLPERRSYVFEGNGQALDHVLVDVRSAEAAEHEVLHLNSGLPGDLDAGPAIKLSDHDPKVVSLKISQ
jgi:predicted extracellular nuclease